MKMSKLLKRNQNSVVICFVSILSIGCFWQIFNVCDLYFKYSTNVLIETDFDLLTKPVPALTFVKYIGPHSGQQSSDALQFESNKIKNQLFKRIYLFNYTRQLILTKEYLHNSIERISHGYYSITVNSLLTVNQSTELRWSDKLIFEFGEYGSNDSSWWLFLHNSFDIPSSSEWNAVAIRPMKLQQITWRLYSFRLLKYPYRTNCKDYRLSSEYLSRRDCIRKCKLNISLSKCQSVFEGIDLGRNEPKVLFGGSDQRQCIERIDLDTICRKQCHHLDCTIDYYRPLNFNKYERNTTTLELIFPTKPETVYYHEPKTATIEFICYLASTFSMWFGLSIYSVRYLFTFCRKKFNNQVDFERRHCCHLRKFLKKT